MHRLSDLTLQDMAICGRRLRKMGDDAASMEEAAGRIVGYLYDHLLGAEGEERACVLVRLYKSHKLSELDPELQSFARRVLRGQEVPAGTRCLTLLATIGDEPAWCSRHRSVGHQAIPLPSVDVVERFPMITQLVRQLGMEIATVVDPEPQLMLDAHQHTFNVFHVQEAAGSPYIPAQQDFVQAYDVRSALGFGGLLPNGDLFASVLFSKVTVSRTAAEMFKPLALAAKLALLPFVGGRVFASGDGDA